MGGVWTADPSNEVNRFLSTSPFGKAMGINDPKLDELILQGQSELDVPKRIAIYKQIEQYVLDQAYVIIPYVYPLRWELVWSNVQGYEVMPSNARLTIRKTWLEG